MPEQEYTIFPPDGACNQALPAHLISDDHILVQVAPLEAMRDGRVWGNATVAADVLAPERIAELRRRYPELPYEVLAKGGAVWLEAWREPVNPPPELLAPAEVVDVLVEDVHAFLARPQLRPEGNGAPATVTLDAENVTDLLAQRETLVRLPADAAHPEQPRLARIVPAQESAEPDGQPTVAVGSVEHLLATSTMKLEGRTVHARLTAANVSELVNRGTSSVAIADDRDSDRVSMVIAVTSSAEALTIHPPPLDARGGRGPRSDTPVSGSMLVRPAETAATVGASLPSTGELALFLPYRQTWELLGYTRGELLSTISLAPEEETTIEVSTWDRRKRDLEDTFVTEFEASAEASTHVKLSAEAVKELSRRHDWGLNVGGDVSVPIQAVQVGVHGNWDDKTAVATLHKGTTSSVIDAMQKVSSRMRTTHQSKVSETHEFGVERKVTRRIRNANKCHTLDLDYFEILATYAVTMTPLVDEARICLLLETPIRDPIDRAFVLGYESELADALLDESLASGFAAARTLMALEHYHSYDCLIECAPPCGCGGTAPAAVAAPPASVGVVAPGSDAKAEAAANVAAAAAVVRQRITALRDASPFGPHTPSSSTTPHVPAAGICALARDILGKHPESEWDVAKTQFKMWLFRKLHLERHATSFWSEAIRYLDANDDSPARLELLLRSGDVKLVDALSQTTAAMNSALTLTTLGTQLGVQATGNMVPLLTNLGFDDAGLDTAMKRAQAAQDAFVDADTMASDSTPASPPDRQTGPAQTVTAESPPAPTPAYDAKKLAEARVAQDALLAHIRVHDSYYRQSVWAALGTDDRLRYLTLLGNLSKHVENRIVGFIGSRAALPLRLDQHPEVAAWLAATVRDNPALAEPSRPLKVTLPTNGVTTGSRLGQCSTAEDFIVRHRELDVAAKEVDLAAARERLEQEKLTTRRHASRLESRPPDLSDPQPSTGAALRVELADARLVP